MQHNYFDFIGVYEEAYNKDFCKNLIEEFELNYSMGLTKTRQEWGEAETHEKEDSSFFSCYASAESKVLKHFSHFTAAFWDLIYKNYSSKYSILRSFATQYICELKIQKTLVGQGYHVWHAENSNRSTSARVLSFVLYLNDVEEGGETEFLYQSKRIKPKTGTLVLFPAAFTHVHRGNPPLSNTKYILTGWVEF